MVFCVVYVVDFRVPDNYFPAHFIQFYNYNLFIFNHLHFIAKHCKILSTMLSIVYLAEQFIAIYKCILLWKNKQYYIH